MALTVPMPRASIRRHRVRLVALLCVAAAVVALAVRWTWFPHELSDYRPMSGGGAMWLGETDYELQDVGLDQGAVFHDETVDLHSVTPRITENSADAIVRVLLCEAMGAGGGGNSWSGLCRSVRPFRPGEVDLAAFKQQLVIAVTPKRPGVVYVAGLDVRYRDGLRTGSQHTGPGSRFVVGSTVR